MALSGLGFLANAQQQTGSLKPESKQLVDKLEDDILDTLQAISTVETKLGRSMDEFQYHIEIPEESKVNLGLILDFDAENSYFDILTISPGSLAANAPIGLNDKILSVNELEATPDNEKTILELIEQLEDGDTLSLRVMQAGMTKDLNIAISAIYTPALALTIGNTDVSALQKTTGNIIEQGCGMVSIIHKPPETRDIHPAFINKIDDNHLMRGRETYKLSTGTHTVYLHELIGSGNFFKSRKGIQQAKPVQIDIKSDTVYHLGAKFIRANKFKTHKGKYWQPIIWKVTNKKVTCD